MVELEAEDEELARFLESDVLSEISDDEAEIERPLKKVCVSQISTSDEHVTGSVSTAYSGKYSAESSSHTQRYVANGMFSKIPSELCRHILKFLSPEDLVACSRVCKFLDVASSDEFLWRHLYSLRWGLPSPSVKLRVCAWKKLYMQRDEEDVRKFVRGNPPEIMRYYIQMHAAKRSQAPLPSQVIDDCGVLDKTVLDQVSIWKTSKGLTDDLIYGHSCSRNTCTYNKIGDVFVCEKTGRLHVCDETCSETIFDPDNGHLVCTISALCFETWVPTEENELGQQQNESSDEAEPELLDEGGRLARAFCIGYDCSDEEELDALR